MDVDQIIFKSLKYPQSSWGKVAILGAIIIVPFILLFLFFYLGVLSNNAAALILLAIIGILIAIIAGIVVYGYLFRAIKATIAGLDELPDFDNIGELIVDGLKVIVVAIVYGLIFGIIMLIPIGLTGLIFGLFGALSTGLTNPAAVIGWGIVGWLIYLVIFIVYLLILFLGILFLIVLPMAIAHMAAKGNFGAAFSFGELRSKIESIRWGKALVWVLASYFVYTVAMMVSFILGLLLVGIVLIPLIVIPFLGLFFARSTALLYINE